MLAAVSNFCDLLSFEIAWGLPAPAFSSVRPTVVLYKKGGGREGFMNNIL